MLFGFIVFFGVVSYAIGLRQMILGKYSPSVFTRLVWLLLTANSFAAVLSSHASNASILLAFILLIGNVAICTVSFWKGSRIFGRLEFVCSSLLAVSLFVWIKFDAPLLNLAIGLTAHFIGAIPTYVRVIKNPHSENAPFWSLFFIASLISIFASQGESLDKVILPVYCTLLDGSLFILSMRRKKLIKVSRKKWL